MSGSPHDKLFKAVFSEPENAAAHFERALPPALVAALDLSRARLVPGSWVDEAFGEHHSDLLYAVPRRGTENDPDPPPGALIYLLWEHQSTVRRRMALKLQRYLTRALDSWSRDHPGQPLPPVIPLVLYHGDAEWTAPTELQALFALEEFAPTEREELCALLPQLRYLVHVVPRDPDLVDAPPGIVRLTLRVLRLGRSPDLLVHLEAWSEDFLIEVANGERGWRRLELIVEYIVIVNEEVTPADVSEALKTMDTKLEHLPEGHFLRQVDKARRQGLEQGKLAALRQTARKLLARGMSPADVADATELPLDEVHELAH